MDHAVELTCEVAKVDDELGLVVGWAIICDEDGVDYFDLQGDHIPQDVMLKSTFAFAKSARVAKEMHEGDARGEVVFIFPMTAEIAKSIGVQTQKHGLLIGMAPDEEMLAKFKSGELRGFSIGGMAASIPVEDDEV